MSKVRIELGEIGTDSYTVFVEGEDGVINSMQFINKELCDAMYEEYYKSLFFSMNMKAH